MGRALSIAHPRGAVTYLSDPPSQPVTLEPSLEPYGFEAVYAAEP